ncbi:MAG: hypothetical protein L0G22_03540 [Propionibacteriaceae bacterium]|nr:hypothetical protein [Propionibacteriaceae bacterium]
MSWPFACQVTGGGRGLLLRRGSAPVVEFAFGLPGDPVAGFEPDDEEVRFTRTDAFDARLRHTPDDTGWTTTVTLDNTTATEQALPPLGVAVTPASGWAAWSWTSDTEGFVVVAPASGGEPCLLVGVRRGFLRAAQTAPVFLATDRRGDGLGPGVAAFHLAHPTGALRGHGRHATTLEFSAIAEPDAAASALPAWLPNLVVRPGDELLLQTPDLGLTPGPGVELTTLGTDALLTAEPGHREVTVHGVRGVQRLRVSFTPDVPALVADLVADITGRRPSACAPASAAVVAGALARRWTTDPERTLDWLEREDWLAREGVFGPAIAGVIANETRDAALLEAACEVVTALPYQPGLAVVGTRLWLGTMRAGLPPFDLVAVFERAADDALSGLENAVLRNLAEAQWAPVAAGFVNRLGGALPGQPVGLPEADAGLAVALLRMVPEHWAIREAATGASEKAASLLLADHADRLHPTHDGLAWLLMGEIGA